jgi:hypothetical protein
MALAEKGWRFKQTSHAIGRVEVLVTGKSLKVTGDKTGFVLVSQAPKWRVYAFNTRSHLICETTADQFAVKFAMVKHASTEMSRMIKARYNTPVKHIWNGITALEYEGRASGKLVTDIWRLPAVTITPQASQILSDLLQVPESDTMTVRASVLQPRKQFKGLFYSYGDKKAFPEADEEHTETWLITESVQKVDVQDSDFNLPKGFKSVDSVTEVWLNMQGLKDSLMDQLDEIFPEKNEKPAKPSK